MIVFKSCSEPTFPIQLYMDETIENTFSECPSVISLQELGRQIELRQLDFYDMENIKVYELLNQIVDKQLYLVFEKEDKEYTIQFDNETGCRINNTPMYQIVAMFSMIQALLNFPESTIEYTLGMGLVWYSLNC